MRNGLKKILALTLAIVMLLAALPLGELSFTGRAEAAGKVSKPNDFLDLQLALANTEVTEIILQKDIDLETTAWSQTESHAPAGVDNYIFVVNGTKTLDLNGHEININSRREIDLYQKPAKYPEQTMFKIVGNLTVNDSSGDNSRIRFNSKVWYASKSPGFNGEYWFVDYRNVFEVMDGATLILNAGDIQAGRSETQWMYGALDNYDIGDSMSGQWFNRYHGNATTVIPGNGVVINPGATFIMNGGSITARAQSTSHKQACIWLNAKDVYSEAPDYSTFEGKTTTIHINDGCLNADAGASVFNHAFPFYSDRVDLRITSGCFDLGKEDKVRQLDNGGTTYYGLSEVVDGWYGESNIPINCIVGYREGDGDYEDRVDLRVTHNRTKFTSIDDAVSRGWLVEKSYTTGKGSSAVKHSMGYFFAGNDVKTGPKTESESGIMRAAYNGTITHSTTVCDDAHIVWYYVDNYWNLDDNPLDLTWSEDAHHAEQFIWHISDGTDTISIVEDCAEISVERIKEELSHYTTMYNRVMSNHSVLSVTCDYGEVYNGYYNYVIKVSTPGSGYKLKFFSYSTEEGANHDWQFSKTITAATCTKDGSHEEVCTLCGSKKTVTDAALGHDIEDGAFAVYENWYEGGHNGSMATTVSYATYHREHHCKRCGLYTGKASHKWTEIESGEATCSTPKIVTKKCKDCGFVYSETEVYEPHVAEHIFDHAGYIVDGGAHWHTCENCGQVFDLANHYDNNGNGLCDVCGSSIATLHIATSDGEPVSHASTLMHDGYVSSPDATYPVYDLKEDWESWFDPETEYGYNYLGYLHTLYVYDTQDTSVINEPSGTKYRFAVTAVESHMQTHMDRLNEYDPSGDLADAYYDLVTRMKKDFYSFVDVTRVDGKLVFSVKKGDNVPGKYGIKVDYQWRYVVRRSYNRDWASYPYKYTDDEEYGRTNSINLGTIQGVLDAYPNTNKPSFDPEKPYYVEIVAKVSFITRQKSIYDESTDNNKEIKKELISETYEAPALTAVAETAADCITPAIHEHYEGDGKYYSYWSNKNSGDGYFTEVIGGKTIQVLTEVELEDLYMGEALGHLYSYGCDQTCNRDGCGFVDETRVHVKASGAKLEPCTQYSNMHGYKCKYCKEVCIDLDYHCYDLVADTEANCGKDGTGHYECTVCGNKLAGTHTIPKGIFEHDWVLDESRTTPVGCENDGTYVFVCSVCGEEKTEYKSMYGHNIEYHEACLPTCVTDGTVECYECLNCGKRWKNSALTQELTGGIFPASEEYHDFTLYCDNGCVCWTACQYCGKILEGSRSELHAHYHQTANEPNCGYNGNIEYWYCNATGTTLYYADAEITQGLTVNEYVDEVFIPATGNHTPAAAVRENEVPATATSDGSYDSVVYCKVCGKEISRQNVVIHAGGDTFEGHISSYGEDSDITVEIFADDGTGKIAKDAVAVYTCLANNGGVYGDFSITSDAVGTGNYLVRFSKAGHKAVVLPLVWEHTDLTIYLKGDITKDGNVNNSDLLKLRRYISDNVKYALDEDQLAIADVTDDGNVNNSDLLKVRRYISDPVKYPF